MHNGIIHAWHPLHTHTHIHTSSPFFEPFSMLSMSPRNYLFIYFGSWDTAYSYSLTFEQQCWVVNEAMCEWWWCTSAFSTRYFILYIYIYICLYIYTTRSVYITQRVRPSDWFLIGEGGCISGEDGVHTDCRRFILTTGCSQGCGVKQQWRKPIYRQRRPIKRQYLAVK